MSEKFESGIPPQEKGERLRVPEITEQLSFLKVWQHGELTLERQGDIEQLFKTAFEGLSENEQRAVSFELQAIATETVGLDKQNEGIQIVRQKEISERVRGVLERSGVIASVKEGEVDRVKDSVLSESAADTELYLAVYEKFARRVMGETEDAKQSAEYVLAIISGIKQEIGRLRLTDLSSAEPQDELREARKYHVVRSSVGTLSNELDKTIDQKGIIGFSTLNKLTKEFLSAKKRLEKYVARTEE